jgi:type I pantothenate kinase
VLNSYEPENPSPYRVFTRDAWARLRADTPLTLSAEDVDSLRSLNDPIDISEVEAIYLPISRLLALYVAATQQLFRATKSFLGSTDAKMPYIIGVAGSVAVGKSTTARILKALLARWPNTPRVELITTDGFLYPNAVLQAQGLMDRKGFPESYDLSTLLRFLSDVKAGKSPVTAPVYSHLTYDVMQGEQATVDRPDILIVEGLNVLQTGRPPRDGKDIPFVSDFFDFSLYIDADEGVIHEWYVERFLRLRQTAFRDPQSFFRKYAEVPELDALGIAEGLWNRINLVNLRENILPTRHRAGLVLRKGTNHRIEQVALRRL